MSIELRHMHQSAEATKTTKNYCHYKKVGLYILHTLPGAWRGSRPDLQAKVLARTNLASSMRETTKVKFFVKLAFWNRQKDVLETKVN